MNWKYRQTLFKVAVTFTAISTLKTAWQIEHPIGCSYRRGFSVLFNRGKDHQSAAFDKSNERVSYRHEIM